jgi:HEPN domain-containing protein
VQLARRSATSRHQALGSAASAVLSAMGPPQASRSRRLLELARQAGDRDAASGDVRAYLAFAEGACALLEGNVSSALKALRSSERIYDSSCPEESWFRTAARGSYLRALYFRGAHPRFMACAEHWLEEAVQRGDAFALAQYALLGQGALRHLISGQVSRALDELELSIRPWTTKGMTITRPLALLTATTVTCYAPELAEARAFFERTSRFSLGMRAINGMMPHGVRASWVLAELAWNFHNPDDAARPPPHLVHRAKALSRESSPSWARAIGQLTQAQLALVAGDRERAKLHAQHALELYDKVLGYRFYARTAAIVLTAAEGAHPGPSCRKFARALRRAGWKDPERGMRQYLPLLWNDRLYRL